MNQGANVRSIEALGELRSALAVYEEEAAAALSMAEADIVRTIDRIRAHNIPHWKKEITRREEMLTRAKSDLARAQMTDHSMGPKSTVDERKAIARARREVEEARIKLRNSQRWFRELEKQYTLYKGRVAPMQRMVAAEMPRARHDLEIMARTLDEYVSISSDADGALQQASRPTVASSGASEGPSRRVWKDLAPSRRLRSRAPLASDPVEVLHAGAGAVRWALLDEDSSRRLALLLGAADAMEIRSFDPAQVARSLGSVAEIPPTEDRVVIDASWDLASPTVLMRSANAPLGDSGWLISRSDVTEPPQELVAIRVGDAIKAYPELAIALSAPRSTVLLVREGELIAVQDERGRPLSAFSGGTLDDPEAGPHADSDTEGAR